MCAKIKTLTLKSNGPLEWVLHTWPEKNVITQMSLLYNIDSDVYPKTQMSHNCHEVIVQSYKINMDSSANN